MDPSSALARNNCGIGSPLTCKSVLQSIRPATRQIHLQKIHATRKDKALWLFKQIDEICNLQNDSQLRKGLFPARKYSCNTFYWGSNRF